MTYAQVLKWMFSQLPVFQRVGKAAYKVNLDNTYAIMAHLNNPHLQFKSIHLAGTNGKGSTAHMLASIYQEAGYKTALYTSPHLRDFRERIRINGQMISQEAVVSFIEENKEGFETIKPSFFEMTVGMAFQYFAHEKVDIAIVETGLGGRLDSTNVIFPELSIITNIGKDHTQFLGDTLVQIAQEKAGIIKKDTPLIVGKYQLETQKVFTQKAQEMHAELIWAADNFMVTREGSLYQIKKKEQDFLRDIHIPLEGNYQKENIQTAVAAAYHQGISVAFIKKGLENVIKNTSLMGRWQILKKQPLCIADTAHNLEGLKLVMEQLKALEYKKLHFVLGVVDDKDLKKILPFFPKDAFYYFCKADIPRALDASELQEKAQQYNLQGEIYHSVYQAYHSANKHAKAEDVIFVGGSTFTVAEIV